MSYDGWILLTASLVGLVCGLVGALLILRRMAMMADAISHTVLLGIVIAYLVTRELIRPHMLSARRRPACSTAVLVQWLHARGVQQEASIGVVFTTLFAIGVVLIATRVGNAHLDVQHALMGEITFIPWETTRVPGLGEIPEAVLTLLIVLARRRRADRRVLQGVENHLVRPGAGGGLGIPVAFMHYLFMRMVSVTAVAAFDAVGAVMVIAMLITPAAAAYLWTDRLSVMLLLSGLFGVLSAFAGYAAAWVLDTSISGIDGVRDGRAVPDQFSVLAAARPGCEAAARACGGRPVES